MSELEQVTDFFNSYAKDFDSIYSEGRLRRWFNRIVRRSMYERLEYVVREISRNPATILDVGCGSGRLAQALGVAAVPFERLVGVDVAPAMIDLAREATQQVGLSDRCEFEVADFMDASFAGSFDYVIALGFFDYIKDPVPFLRRMSECANKRIIASFPTFSLIRSGQRKVRYALMYRCPVYFYRAEAIARLADEAGLRNIKVRKMRGGPGADALLDAESP